MQNNVKNLSTYVNTDATNSRFRLLKQEINS